MEIFFAWGMLLLVLVLAMLHATHKADQRRIAEVDRRIAILMESTRAGAEPCGPCTDRVGATNQSRPLGNGPEIAKFEGVQRGRRNY
jgi:hypothetical protein